MTIVSVKTDGAMRPPPQQAAKLLRAATTSGSLAPLAPGFRSIGQMTCELVREPASRRFAGPWSDVMDLRLMPARQVP